MSNTLEHLWSAPLTVCGMCPINYLGRSNSICPSKEILLAHHGRAKSSSFVYLKPPRKLKGEEAGYWKKN
eukprot:c16149_g1_i1 orf=631-840(+)